jgi:hypothetical protein
MNLTDHLKMRHMDLSLHKVWINEEEDVAVFPLWTLSGNLVGYQNYRRSLGKTRRNLEDGKYHTYRNRLTAGIWGLESWSLSDTLFLTEGVFDAARLTERGCSAVALLANDTGLTTKHWLSLIRSGRRTVAVCDPGSAGAKLAKNAHRSVVVDLGNDIDLSDAPDEYVDELIKEYS